MTNEVNTSPSSPELRDVPMDSPKELLSPIGQLMTCSRPQILYSVSVSQPSSTHAPSDTEDPGPSSFDSGTYRKSLHLEEGKQDIGESDKEMSDQLSPGRGFFTLTTNDLARSSDSITPTVKGVEISRLKTELTTLKLLQRVREEEHERTVTALNEELKRLRTDLSAATPQLKEAVRVPSLEKDLKDVTEQLHQTKETLATSQALVSTLEREKGNLLSKVPELESEIYYEKQHSAEVQQNLAETMKQLLSSKNACETDLANLQDLHRRCISDAAKVELNLRTELSFLQSTCKELKEKQEITPECSELTKLLDTKTQEVANLHKEVELLEEKLIKISTQLANERAHHCQAQNVLSDDNESLKLENETMKLRMQTEVRDFEGLHRKLQECEMRIQGEASLKSTIDELQRELADRDSEIRGKMTQIEIMKLNARDMERRCGDAENRCREKLALEKSEESEYILKLTQSKIEAERNLFEEIEKRAKAEGHIFMLQNSLKEGETERNHLREMLKRQETDSRSLSKSVHLSSSSESRSFQFPGTFPRSPAKPKSVAPTKPEVLVPTNEIEESAVTPTVLELLKPTINHNAKEANFKSDCNCSLW